MAMVTTQNWEVHMVDAITAFLNVLMKGELVMYIRPLDGYETYDDEGHLLY